MNLETGGTIEEALVQYQRLTDALKAIMILGSPGKCIIRIILISLESESGR